MQFVEKYVATVHTIDNQYQRLGLFDSYDEANDTVIMEASKNLPDELVIEYSIERLYINLACVKVEKGG